MDDSIPEVEIQVSSERLSASQPNSVIVVVHSKSEEFFRYPRTRRRTRWSSTVSPSLHIHVNLSSSSHHHIRSLLHDRLGSYHWLCDDLAYEISTAANNLGFGSNGFTLTVVVTVTYQGSNFMRLMKVVLLGRMRSAEELKSLKMETDRSCSICLENLCDGKGLLTRTTCSHVFHCLCLLECLLNKNTCPLCRNVLTDISFNSSY